jgi:branched-chain amino acid transport system permease protein
MSRAIKVGLWSGLFGLITAVMFGGMSVLMVGMICGVIAGMVGGRTDAETVRDGMRNGMIAGGTAAVILFLATLLRNVIVNPLVGQPIPPISQTLLIALLTAVLSLGIGMALGAVHYLPGRQSTFGTWGILAVICLIFPFLDRIINLGWLGIVITSLIFVLLALGLNVVVGYAGLLDLGYAAFFAIGAYTAAFLSSDHFNIHVTFWLVIWISAATAAIFGLILGTPTLPLRGDYLAIVTLGFGEIVPIVFRNLDNVSLKIGSYVVFQNLNVTAGELGITPIDPPKLPGVNFADRSDQRAWYFLLLALILFSIFIINRLRRSRIGRAWMAMREDELAASSMGINIVRTKLMAFAMGASFSGFGGAYYAIFVSGTFPSAFDFSVSVIVLCMVILGGLGNISGVIVGGLIIELSDRLFLPQISLFMQSLAANNRNLIALQKFDPTLYRVGLFGLVLVLMMQLRPEGLLPNARVRMQLHAAEESPVEASQERSTLYDVEAEGTAPGTSTS